MKRNSNSKARKTRHHSPKRNCCAARLAVLDDVRMLARNKGADAFRIVAGLMKSEDERVALAAAQAVLDRGYGKPTQTVDMTVQKRSVEDYTDAELMAIIGGDETKAGKLAN